jgi:hypothetical protein
MGNAALPAKDAIARLKILRGTWTSNVTDAEHTHNAAHSKVIDRLPGAGSAFDHRLRVLEVR